MFAALDTKSILVVEDSSELVSLLQRVLREHGYDVRSASDGDIGIASALIEPPDLVILDVGLPRRDGFEVIRELRRHGFEAPTLILTARKEVADRITGLESGADDYLVKPFDTDELVARVRALLRRSSSPRRNARLTVADVVLDPVAREAYRGNRQLALTQREFAVLEVFMRNVGVTLSRATIAEQVWRDAPIDVDATNVVDVYVAYLRRKLDSEGDEPLLHTVRGLGYVLRATGGTPGSAPERPR